MEKGSERHSTALSNAPVGHVETDPIHMTYFMLTIECHSALAVVSVTDENAPMSFIRQLPTRSISKNRLVDELKSIQTGLLKTESKCIQDNVESSKCPQATFEKKQWRALRALHRTLLHEHYDFFLASQHPSASPALREIARKDAMPARMWRHGIHTVLERLCHQLPASMEYMLEFFYIAYSMLALLDETIPRFHSVWAEYRGSLAQYR